MNERTKKILLWAGIGLVAVVIMVSFFIFMFYQKMQNETKNMSLVETSEPLPGIFAVKDNFVNFFILKKNDAYIAVDAGLDGKNAEQELKKLNIDPDKISAVLLTHTDYDHTGSIKIFKNAKIFISQEEVQMIDGKTARSGKFYNTLDTAYETLKDGQLLKIAGFEIECVLSPGHTHGSMSYIIEEKYLFSGDNMSLINGKAGLFNDFFNMDSNLQKVTLGNLSKLEKIKYIFTAHYGYTNDFLNAFRR